MNNLAIGDKLQTIKEISIGGCEDVEASEKIFDLCDEILGLVNSVSCNCKHNNNLRYNEPCCRCDSRQTNADRIRNMSDEELAGLLFDKSRCDNCFANCNDKDNCPSLGSCYSRHLEWLQSEAK